MSVHPGSIYFDNNWSQLERTRGGKWVAANGDGLVAENRHLDQLYDELKQQQRDLDGIAVAYIPEAGSVM